MTGSLRTLYTSQDPDSGAVVLGYYTDVPLICSLLSNAISTPITTDGILLINPPTDFNGPDFIQGSVTATPSNTTTSNLEKTFTFVQTKGLKFAGTVQVYANATIDLDQVDATYPGAAGIDSIVCELIRYQISTSTPVSMGVQTHTINKQVSGIVTNPGKAEPTVSELFLFDVGLSQITIGQFADYLLQVRIRINYSAFTGSSATVNTIAKCRLNCYRNLSRNCKMLLPVV